MCVIEAINSRVLTSDSFLSLLMLRQKKKISRFQDFPVVENKVTALPDTYKALALETPCKSTKRTSPYSTSRMSAGIETCRLHLHYC